MTHNSSIVSCNSNIDRVNNTSITPSSLSFNADKGPSLTVVHTDALRVCNDNSLLFDDITSLFDIRSDDICNTNRHIRLLVSKRHDSTISSLMKQVLPVLGSGINLDGFGSIEKMRLIKEPNILQGDFITDDASMYITMSTMGAKELTVVHRNVGLEMKLDCKTSRCV